MNILDRIVEQKQREVSKLPHETVTPEKLRAVLDQRSDRRDFFASLRSPRGIIGAIAEIKKASPSAGVIRPDFHPVTIARQYDAAGADCLSILTDEQFFQGSLSYLEQVRQAVRLPLLRKDFIIDERQILEAAKAGADAILLIVAILTNAQLKDYLRLAEAGGLSVLVEVHDPAELDRALASGARLIGVNNRNLKTFQVDLATTEKLAPQITGAGRLLVAESGIHSRADVERLARCGAGAILVGESLMRQPDPGEKLRELTGAPA